MGAYGREQILEFYGSKYVQNLKALAVSRSKEIEKAKGSVAGNTVST